MIQTPILEKTYYHFIGCTIWESGNGKWEFCGKVFNRLFILPATATHIQIVAYNRAAKGRVRVEFDDSGFVTVGHNSRHYIMSYTRDAITKLIGKRKVLYIELYYWEDKK